MLSPTLSGKRQSKLKIDWIEQNLNDKEVTITKLDDRHPVVQEFTRVLKVLTQTTKKNTDSKS